MSDDRRLRLRTEECGSETEQRAGVRAALSFLDPHFHAAPVGPQAGPEPECPNRQVAIGRSPTALQTTCKSFSLLGFHRKSNARATVNERARRTLTGGAQKLRPGACDAIVVPLFQISAVHAHCVSTAGDASARKSRSSRCLRLERSFPRHFAKRAPLTMMGVIGGGQIAHPVRRSDGLPAS